MKIIRQFLAYIKELCSQTVIEKRVETKSTGYFIDGKYQRPLTADEEKDLHNQMEEAKVQMDSMSKEMDSMLRPDKPKE